MFEFVLMGIGIAILIVVFCSVYTATHINYLTKDVFKHWLETIKLNQEIIELNNEILNNFKKENTNA